MKRILIFSDTHGDIKSCIDVINRVPANMIIHAGDMARDVSDLKKHFPDKDIRSVRGNNEFFCEDPYDDIIEVDGIRIFVTHGHKYGVKFEHDYRTLAEAAARSQCQIAVFGHTHTAYSGETFGVKLLNPGTSFFKRSYGVIEIENGRIGISVITD